MIISLWKRERVDLLFVGLQCVCCPSRVFGSNVYFPVTPRETRYRDIGGCEISEVNK